MGACLTAGKKGGIGRFHSNDLNFRKNFFQFFCRSGKCAACSHTGNETIHFSVGIFQYLFCRRSFMDSGIRLIFKLLGHEGTGIFLQYFLCFGNRPFHAVRSGGEDKFCPVSSKKFSSFHAHGIRHGENKFISFHGGSKSQPHSGITACGFNDKTAFFQESGFFCFFDHIESHSVLAAAAGIEGFRLYQDLHIGGDKFIDPDKGGMPDTFQNIIEDLSHFFLLFQFFMPLQQRELLQEKPGSR